MKKCGIITFQRANNYGAKLQAYALQETLSTIFDTKIVDYRSPKIEQSYTIKKTPKSIIKYLIKSILFHKYVKGNNNRTKKFNFFNQKYLKLSDSVTCNDLKMLNDKFDFFVSGSDQIWNLNITDNDYNYYLSFADDCKKYSYAASFGNMDVLKRNVETIVSYLSKYNTILCREEDACNFLKNCGLKNINTVLDPVFLLKKEDWINKFNLCFSNGSYILIYNLSPQKYSNEFAKKLSNKLNLKVKFININGSRNVCPDGFENVLDAGPIDFLNLILNASYVVTTSFHAVAFSIIFNKPFYYELNAQNNNNNSRLENIAKIFNLENRRITDEELHDNNINWDTINNIIDIKSKMSKDLLFDTILKDKYEKKNIN